jgi:hypothetical protein
VPVEHIPVTSKTSTGRTDFITINPDINVHWLQEQTGVALKRGHEEEVDNCGVGEHEVLVLAEGGEGETGD